ncbi:hypothetical protein H5410_032181 [Solanum commersonii]|uniref:Uncharacterized protein n=1 Tax=Solanum commersonii TaxID=4109 RepID=A0A9J5YJ85_SOLCO|nr:hypothetical protein H5410_032181 [Solanum commersonii]
MLSTRFGDKPWSLKVSVKQKRGSFKYLGSIIRGNWEIDEDVTHRIGASMGQSVLVKNFHIQKIVAVMRMT